jgi:SOS response regulatory protein OraA/RecX
VAVGGPAPKITALRPERRGRVLVELDGVPWRALAEDVVVRSGLRAGLELDRERLRTVALERRRHDALTKAARLLRYRDLSEQRLAERLARAGVRAPERAEALDTLGRAGFVDDGRYALERARSLAGRGFGGAAIQLALEQDGVAGAEVEAALAALEPERDRATRIAARRGRTPATARYLAGRGFGEDAVESAVGPFVAEDE